MRSGWVPGPPERQITNGPGETEALAAALAATLVAGDVVLIDGELGAGKTTFVRGACRELGVEEAITSPTFTIGHRYEGRIPISHLDLYRLGSLDDEEPGVLDDYLTADAIAFVEWPAAGGAELGERARATVEIAHGGGDRREIGIRS